MFAELLFSISTQVSLFLEFDSPLNQQLSGAAIENHSNLFRKHKSIANIYSFLSSSNRQVLAATNFFVGDEINFYLKNRRQAQISVGDTQTSVNVSDFKILSFNWHMQGAGKNIIASHVELHNDYRML